MQRAAVARRRERQREESVLPLAAWAREYVALQAGTKEQMAW